MNVLYLNHSAQISGAERSLRALLWQMRRAHDDVSPAIVLPGNGPFAELLRAEEWNVTFAPLRRLNRPTSVAENMAALFYVMRTAPYLSKVIQQTRSDIVHSNSTTAHLVGGLAASRAGKPALWHARDLVSLERIAPTLADRADAIIAISGCVAESLQRDGVPAEKIRIVYNGLNPDEWQPRDEATRPSNMRASLAPKSGEFLFGCVAQMAPWKNHRAFIEAAALLAQDEGCANARFCLIGGDLWGEHRDYATQLREDVKKHNLQERFNFVPFQSDNVDAMSGLDALVLPSHEEPFGRVLIEAMALQKPAIAFAQNGPLEIISHGQDGLLVTAAPAEEESDEARVLASDAEALATAMKEVLRDENLRAHLQQNARATVTHKFNIDSGAQQIREIYQEIKA